MKSELEALVSRMQDGGILYAEAVEEFKKIFIQVMIERHHGNKCRAARALGMHRNTLGRTMAVLKIQRRPPERASDRRIAPTSRVA